MISGVQEARWKRFLFQLKFNLVFPVKAICSFVQAPTDCLTDVGRDVGSCQPFLSGKPAQVAYGRVQERRPTG